MKRTLKDIIKRFFIIMSAAISFSLLVPKIVPIIEAHHECNHQDCAICEVIRVSKDIQKQEIIIDPPVVVYNEEITFKLSEDIISINDFSDFNTPITLKNKISS